METSTSRQSGPWVLAAVIVASGMLSACQYSEIQDPWVSGEQYQQERMRDAQTWEQLRHRARYNQTDR